MNSTLLSLCLCGAGLATASLLLAQHPTCPSRESATASHSEWRLAKTEAASSARAEPTAKTQSAPQGQSADPVVTGTIKQTAKTAVVVPEGAAPTPPKSNVKPYRQRKYGWKRYRYPPPPVGFAIRVYPRW
jgi:hypothetical protein